MKQNWSKKIKIDNLKKIIVHIKIKYVLYISKWTLKVYISVYKKKILNVIPEH